jgi:hypothetical protein
MSARSRASPWFSVSLEQRVAWQLDGQLCEHGVPRRRRLPLTLDTPIDTYDLWRDPFPGCIACDMAAALGLSPFEGYFRRSFP